MRRILPACAFFAFTLLSASWGRWTDEDAPPPPLKPGLVVTCRDAGKPPVEVTSLEPTITLALRAGEAPHPTLTPEGLTVRWEGQLKILRAADYTFGAHVLGRFRLSLDGKEALRIEGDSQTKSAAPLATMRLDAGNHPLVAEFTRLPGPARVQLFWRAKHFFPEPVPFDVLGHLPSQEPQRLVGDLLVERGRFLTEEHSCTACHRAGDDDRLALALVNRQGPDLSRVGERVRPEWFAGWLGDPKHLQADAVMPALFAPGPEGEAEIFAVAAYLTSLGGPLKASAERSNANDLKTSRARGERLFNTVGCVACHDATTELYPLAKRVQGKTTVRQLARFLQNPLETHPAGHMPNMLLNGQEATDLARFLIPESIALPAQARPERRLADQTFARVDARADERTSFQKLTDDRAWTTLGERLVLERRCNACHKIEPQGKPFARLRANADFAAIRKTTPLTRGCLADGEPSGEVPRFAFKPEEKRALRAFLSQPTWNRATPARAYAARATLQRFKCLSCHQRDGQGGLTTELSEQLRKFEYAENAEAVSPPPLTGIGAKLTTAWLRKILVEGGRARPWMGLRMPQFGPGNVGHLPEAFVACDGIDGAFPADPTTASFDPVYVEADTNAGRFLVGKKAFGCVGCHDIAGVPSSGTRGPDLAAMNQRVRYDWYRRWLVQPQKMQPGTRMPIIFHEGRTLLDEVLDGSAEKQANAMWSYLALGPTLPLPEGLDPPKGLILTVKDRPVVLRTFMPDAGSKAIAIGYPGHVSVAYDAAQCRLAYAWSGNFLDASPVWNDRGGNPARILGTRFWEAPRGFPWAVIPLGTLPDFAGQAGNAAFGAALPEGQTFSGPMRLHSDGYQLGNSDGQPTFLYHLDLPGSEVARFQERAVPQRIAAGVGIRRDFTLTVPSSAAAWLLLGESSTSPLLLDAQGKSIDLDPKTGGEAEARAVAMVGSGNRTGVTRLEAAPPGARLRVQRQGSTWQALLRIPATGQPQTLGVSHWQPYREDKRLVVELVGAK